MKLKCLLTLESLSQIW